MIGSLALGVSYGLEVGREDPILEIAEKGSQSLFEIANAGAYLGTSINLNIIYKS